MPGKHRKVTRHGLCRHPLYKVYYGMLGRCYNKNTDNYHNYGGRGITVCDQWKNSFENFYKWVISKGYEKGLTVERINNDGNYCPENCTLIPQCEQPKNTRDSVKVKAFGEEKILADWHKDPRCVVSYEGLRTRIVELGIDPELAITEKWLRRKTITAFGESKLLEEWQKDERCLCEPKLVLNRIQKLNWSSEKALSTPPRALDTTKLEAFGENKSIMEWSRDSRCPVNHDVIRKRLTKGIQPEVAITTPSISTKIKKGEINESSL